MRSPTSCSETPWTSTSPSTPTMCNTCCFRLASTSTWASGRRRSGCSQAFLHQTDSRLHADPSPLTHPLVLLSPSGSGHPAAHSGVGPLPARGRGLPGPAHAGAHPAQEAPRCSRGEEAPSSGAPGGPVLRRPHHETQEVRWHSWAASRRAQFTPISLLTSLGQQSRASV